MATKLPMCFFLLICMIAINAKVINVNTDASYFSKLHAGFSQALNWMGDMVVPEDISREPRKVKLALVGLGRTGSSSFSAGLKELGYAPIHDDEATEVADLYAAMMADSSIQSLDAINTELGKRGFDAPMISTHKYVEWAAVAPDIKVIITVRDKKKWAQSWLAVTPAVRIVESRPFTWVKAIQDMQKFNREVMVNVPTNGIPELYEDIPTLEAGYEAWVDFVRKTVPKDRLLEFNVKQGWEPLCKFLGKQVPVMPFPHINDRVVVDTIIKVMLAVTWLWPVLLATPLLLIGWCMRCMQKKASWMAKNSKKQT